MLVLVISYQNGKIQNSYLDLSPENFKSDLELGFAQILLDRKIECVFFSQTIPETLIQEASGILGETKSGKLETQYAYWLGHNLDLLVEMQVFDRKPGAVDSESTARAVTEGLNGIMKEKSGKGYVASCTFSGNTYAIPIQESKFGWGNVKGNLGYGLWIWTDRIGKPYQADLDKHVTTWRLDPRPFSRDVTYSKKLLDLLSPTMLPFGVDLEGKTLSWIAVGKDQKSFIGRTFEHAVAGLAVAGS